VQMKWYQSNKRFLAEERQSLGDVNYHEN